MNKNVIIGLIVAVVVLGGGLFALMSKSGSDTPKVSNTSQSQDDKKDTAATFSACDILTESIAKRVLGDSAEKSTDPGGASTDDIAVSNCTYGVEATSIANIKGASVLLRYGKTDTGKVSNKAVFGSGAPAGSVRVDGFGDDANFANGQLNILKGGNWYIVSNYTGTNPTKATVDQAKELARLLEFK